MTVCDPRIWAGCDMLGQTSPMVPCAWRQGRSNGRTILTSSQATGRRIGITSESFACALKWNLLTLDGLTFAGHGGTTQRPISPSLNFAVSEFRRDDNQASPKVPRSTERSCKVKAFSGSDRARAPSAIDHQINAGALLHGTDCMAAAAKNAGRFGHFSGHFRTA